MKRRASLDPVILAQVMSNLFDAEGKPSPTLKKVVTHFKDRFREAAAMLVTELGGATLGKPSSKNETTKDGSRILLSLKLDNPTYSLRDLGPIKLNRVRDRLLTPTMRQAGFELRTNEVINDRWGDVLRNREDGVVMVYIAPSGNGVVLQAALLFHHPSDEANEGLAAPEVREKLPTNEVMSFRDGVMFLEGRNMLLQDKTHFYLTAKEAGQPATKVAFASDDDPQGWALINAMSIPAKATYFNMVAEAEKLGAKVGREEHTLKDLQGNIHILRANVAQAAKDLAKDLLTAAGASDISAFRGGQAGIITGLGMPDAGMLSVALIWNVEDPRAVYGEWTISLKGANGETKRSGRGEPSGSSAYDLFNIGSLQKYVQECLEGPMTADLAWLVRQARQG